MTHLDPRALLRRCALVLAIAWLFATHLPARADAPPVPSRPEMQELPSVADASGADAAASDVAAPSGDSIVWWWWWIPVFQ